MFRTLSISKKKSESRTPRLSVECLETRAMLTKLSVDVNDAACTNVGPVYCEIQDAVDVASPGDKIKVASGMYSGVVIGVNGITVAGNQNAPAPIVDGGVGVIANGVTIRGLESNSSGAFNFYTEGNYNSFIGNVASNSLAGFVVQGGSYNAFINNVSSGQLFGGFGIFGGNNNKLIGNTSTDNGSFLAGFIVVGNDNRLVNNTASGGSAGFDVEGNNNQLTANTAIANNFRGFNVFQSDGTRLQANRAIDNAGDGFHFAESDNSVVTGNKSEGNAGYGYAVDAVMANIFNGNHCDGNLLGGDNQGGAIC